MQGMSGNSNRWENETNVGPAVDQRDPERFLFLAADECSDAMSL